MKVIFHPNLREKKYKLSSADRSSCATCHYLFLSGSTLRKLVEHVLSDSWSTDASMKAEISRRLRRRLPRLR